MEESGRTCSAQGGRRLFIAKGENNRWGDKSTKLHKNRPSRQTGPGAEKAGAQVGPAGVQAGLSRPVAHQARRLSREKVAGPPGPKPGRSAAAGSWAGPRPDGLRYMARLPQAQLPAGTEQDGGRPGRPGHRPESTGPYLKVFSPFFFLTDLISVITNALELRIA
jgi:hypothetical protein